MRKSIKDIEAWLREDAGDEGLAKTASSNQHDGDAGYDPEGELMMKLAEQFEDEQFEKLANDAWTMGEIMGHAFINTLEKVAIADVDDRIAGDISDSVQGEPPMMAQKVEDEKPTDIVPGKNVVAPMVDAMIDQKLTQGATSTGGNMNAQEGQVLSPPPAPSGGNVEQTDADVMQKKVAHFLRQRLGFEDSNGIDKEAARDILKQLVKGDL